MKNIGGETEIRWWNQLGGKKFGGEIYLVVKNTGVKNSVEFSSSPGLTALSTYLGASSLFTKQYSTP